ncbi:hypothetical protein DKX38_016983 [Salix brachista]|uniref:Uncharacterized protein n=1 Tax=Salix brachista TaxID=2182728 RepID=A0A5N5KU19_9ROSI|nr:hypothetical protein DKX38_016983 [Salix brachista]
MARNIGFLVCLLIMVLDVAAGILGIEAEVAQNKVKHLKMWVFECRDPSSQAFKLGLAAVILLSLAHIIATLLGGCTCMWIILAIGFSLLIIGTMANSKSRKSCGISHNRVLSIGGILCFVHGLFTVSYYVSATATARDVSRHQDANATQA